MKQITKADIPDIRSEVFTLTGTFDCGCRELLWKQLEACDAEYNPRITKTTTVLVTGWEPGQNSIAKAEKYGIPVMNQYEFAKLIHSQKAFYPELAHYLNNDDTGTANSHYRRAEREKLDEGYAKNKAMKHRIKQLEEENARLQSQLNYTTPQEIEDGTPEQPVVSVAGSGINKKIQLPPDQFWSPPPEFEEETQVPQPVSNKRGKEYWKWKIGTCTFLFLVVGFVYFQATEDSLFWCAIKSGLCFLPHVAWGCYYDLWPEERFT